MLSEKMQNALNNQIAEEAYASHYYLSMASWCEKSGLQGSASFLYRQSEQERQHMLKLFHYVNDAGGHATIRAVKEPVSSFKTISDIFGQTLEHEKNITRAINNLVDV